MGQEAGSLQLAYGSAAGVNLDSELNLVVLFAGNDPIHVVTDISFCAAGFCTALFRNAFNNFRG